MARNCLQNSCCYRYFTKIFQRLVPVVRVLQRNIAQESRKAEDVEVNKGPLSGYRVVDLTRILAGPYCTMILGDHGAEVIKIENPNVGDDTRIWGPPFINGESTYFMSVNRNKKSIAVNLKNRDGADIVRELIKKSDVLVENYVPGKLAEYGLDYTSAKKLNEKLVYCSITGYGQTGPWSKRAGYDAIASAVGGLMDITGPENGEPCKVGVALTDESTGLYAYGAIMAALLHRERTGLGQHVDCNLLSTQVAMLTHIGSAYLNAGVEGKRYGTAHGNIVPYQAFQTSDGYIVLGATNDGQFQRLVELIGLSHLADDGLYRTNPLRVKHRDTLLEILSDRFREESTDKWLDVFEGSGLAYGPINTTKGVFDNPQVIHNNMIQEVNHPTAGKIRLPAPAVSFSETRAVLQCPPPTLAQDTDNVLQNILKYTAKEIQELKESGAVQ